MTTAIEVAGAHYGLGDSLARDGRHAEAEKHLRACIALEAPGSFSHRTELRLAEVLIEKDTVSVNEAWDLLNVATGQGMLFSSDAWRIEVARARLLARRGDKPAAAKHARNALRLLEHNAPQLPRHPDVGLIVTDRATEREMKRLAKA